MVNEQPIWANTSVDKFLEELRIRNGGRFDMAERNQKHQWKQDNEDFTASLGFTHGNEHDAAEDEEQQQYAKLVNEVVELRASLLALTHRRLAANSKIQVVDKVVEKPCR